MWAAYQMGMWKDIIPEDLDAKEFEEHFDGWLSTIRFDLDWIMEAEYQGKVRPIGIMLAWLAPGERRLEPHVEWFPWATPRTRFESVTHFLWEIRKEFKVHIWASDDDKKFFDTLTKHIPLVMGTVVKDEFSPGESATLYYTAGPFV